MLRTFTYMEIYENLDKFEYTRRYEIAFDPGQVASISKRKWNVCGWGGLVNYEGCYVTLKNGRGYLLVGKSDEIYKSIVGTEH